MTDEKLLGQLETCHYKTMIKQDKTNITMLLFEPLRCTSLSSENLVKGKFNGFDISMLGNNYMYITKNII